MKRTHIPKAAAIPAAGVLAVTLAVMGTVWTGSAAEDEGPEDSDGGDTVSHSVSPSEAEETAHYWTPERMRNAKPG